MCNKKTAFIFFVFIYSSLTNTQKINSLIPFESIKETEHENVSQRNISNLNNLTYIDKNKKNLIIGSILNYSWSKVKLFFISLYKAQIKNCDFVIFVGGVSNETIKKIEKCGVTTYKIPKEVLRLRKTITLFRWKLYKEINII